MTRRIKTKKSKMPPLQGAPAMTEGNDNDDYKDILFPQANLAHKPFLPGEKEALEGQTVWVKEYGLVYELQILACKFEVGHRTYLVTPWRGAGQRWMRHRRLFFEPPYVPPVEQGEQENGEP